MSLLTVKDAAELLGVHPTAVQRFANNKLLPSTRTAGGIRLFERADVIKLRDRRAAKVS